MSADDIVLTAERTDALDAFLASARTKRQPIFWFALLTAALVHGVFIVGVASRQPRTIGDPGGDKNAIDVELVDASELTSGDADAGPPPGPPPSPTAAQQPPQEPAPQQQEPPAETAPPDKAAPPAEAAVPKKSPAPTLSLDAQEQQAPAPAKPVEKPAQEKSEPKKEAKAAKPAKPAKPKASLPKNLDLSVPSNLALQGSADSGASSAFRPPGITRSGENDRFGRDVVRALKKTMPRDRGKPARVTVRILLNKRGNIAKIQIVEGSDDTLLNQDVIFSAREAVMPFPPKNATVADRTFLITYVYR